MNSLGSIVRRLRGGRSQAWLAAQVPVGDRTRHQTWVGAVERGVLACSVKDFNAICDACEAGPEDRAAGLKAIAEHAARTAGLTAADVWAAVGA